MGPRHWLMAAGAMMIVAGSAAAQQKLGAYQTERPPARIYEQTCGYCHGKNVGPILLGRKLPAETISYIVRHGQNGMPTFRPTEITKAELDALAKWIEKSPARTGEHGQ